MPCALLMEAWRRPAAMKRESLLVVGISRRMEVTVNEFRWGKEKEEIRNEVVPQFIFVSFLEMKDAATKIHEKRIKATE